MNFQSCEIAEFKTNPAPLGVLSYKVTYDKGHFVSLEKQESKNTFSDTFVNCVESYLKSFSPGYSKKVEYQMNI
jgi:hypothetical protein